MTAHFKLLRGLLAIFLFLFPISLAVSQPLYSSQAPALLEITHSHCVDGCESYTTRIYADGRFVVEDETYRKAKSGRLIKILTRRETRLEIEELAELMSLTEQPDFLNAQSEYSLHRVQDNPSSVTITYRKDNRQKRITVGNYLIASEVEKSKLPPSILKLIERIKDIAF